jgi:1-acyl-sn-glycerol-3-phosphate acyltransferase
LQALAWTPARVAYAIYAAITFLILGLALLVATLILPGVYRRRAAARAVARAFLRAAGMPLTVRGLDRLAAGQCIVVANHASYLDGLVFTAALPARFSFVIKREMSAVPLVGLFLRRIGSEFVERFDRHRGAADARRMLRNAASGHSLVFFPEGTFTRTPGLLKFHTGAFATATRAACPVIPAVVRGTRAALPPSGGLPSPGRIEIDILPPIEPQPQAGEPSSAALRDRARGAILVELGEPDLTCSDDTARPPDTEHARSAPASRS